LSKTWSYVLVAIFAMIPTYEARYAIPTGITLWDTAVVPTYIIATLIGFLPSPFIILTIEKLLALCMNSKIKVLKSFGTWLNNKIERAKGKIDKVDQEKKIAELELSGSRRDHLKAKRLKHQMKSEGGRFGIWSFIALMLFVAIPLPGTGVWTGSMAAGMLKLRLRQALPPIFIGNIIAGLITTLITIGLIPALF
jgi:uncharacterized membrane protein